MLSNQLTRGLALCILTLFSFVCLSHAQSALDPILEKNYRQYQLQTCDTDRLYDKLKDRSQFHEISLEVGDRTIDLQLWDSGIRSDDYKVTLASGKTLDTDPPVLLKGHVKGKLGSKVRLTINHGFLYGFITDKGKILNVQPARYHDSSADEDLMVFYYDEDVKEKLPEHSCGVTEAHRIISQVEDHKRESGSVGLCFEIEIAFAADWSMTDKYGSANAADNHMAGVLNAVEGNYDDEFADEILFDISDSWISDCSTCDPWTSSLDMGALLNDFTGWAPTEFGSHQLGSLWSNRNFAGSAIGLAWLGGACGGFGYNVCEDFTNNGNFLRVLLAHEIGHNLNADHDGASGLIMSPSVSGSSSWSSASMTDIENFMSNNSGCFIDCSSGDAPEADFDWTVISECVPGEVEFIDDSDDAVSWFWTFQGGSPATSTDQNPVVLYHNAGTYDVTLEVTNPFGSDTKIEQEAISISDFPVAGFNYETDELDVSFFDQSTGGDNMTYYWEFGDGNTSTQQEPDHNYSQPGTYTVFLEVANICNISIYTQEIIVYDNPEANFYADPTSACNGEPINFTDTSYGIIDNWDWTFPGGTPSSSTLQDPQITYVNPGVYEVTLEVSNPEGDNSVTYTDYITIETIPEPTFIHEINSNTVTFVNTTSGANSYSWDFGDGNTSTQTSPTHTYTSSGQYVALLIAENACGVESEAITLTISIEPSAQIGTAGSTSGCATHSISYVDNSLGSPTAWNWSFPGGNPSSSTAPNPTVSYAQQGNYDVTLWVSNAFGQDSITLTNYVTVDDIPSLTASHTNNLLTALFTSTYSNAAGVSWNFGDGNSSTDPNPSHNYAVAGTYNVSVSASNGCGTVTENLVVTVNENPTANFSSNVTEGCATLMVGFQDNSGGNPTEWSWNFPGGTPASSTDRHPTVSYDQAGSYNVTLQVTNPAGTDVITMNNHVVVNDVPTLTAGYSNNLLQVEFNSISSNATSLNWNFGDGNSSSEQNPSHTYAVSGTYDITVSASNSCGTVTENLSVTVNSKPTPGINSDVRSGCAPLTVNYLDASSSNTTAWNWNFPGGNPSSSTEQNPTVSYTSAGLYDVSLSVSNVAGSESQTWSEYIEVLTGPSASYEAEVNGNQLSLKNTTPGTTAAWTVSDGASYTQQNIVHTLDANGNYQVTLEVTNSCGTDQVSFDVAMDVYPESSFSIASINTGCAPLTVEYNNTSTQATAYNWSFPGGNPSTSTDANPVVEYNFPGTFDVSLVVFNPYGSDNSMSPSAIEVLGPPQADFASDANGSMIRFTNTSTGANSYSWDFGDGNTSEMENPAHSYDTAGDYVVTFTATNDCGSSTVERVVLIDFTLPTINSSFSVTSGCAPLEVQITDMTTNNPTNWLWEFPGGSPATSTDQNPVVTYDIPGIYSINAVVSNADGSSSTVFPDVITVGDVPISEFLLTQDSESISLENNSLGATSYSWDFGDGNTSVETEPEHVYTEPGDYVVILTAINDCGSVESSFSITVEPSSIVETGLEWKWTLAPNPTRRDVSLMFEQATEWNLDYEVVDLMGRSVKAGHILKGSSAQRIQLEESGVFLVILKRGTLLDVKKLIVIE